ncbi:peptide deformylase, mitochondrial-like [Apis dorsata]|uniref:peptide deformylase, mitochondrial-like n=1 Tax=Apis dorsata TaxID=7462 RepID=UPI0003DF66E1|nr:peptide deformylase, mitochondrial-like [Apis dorsata]
MFKCFNIVNRSIKTLQKNNTCAFSFQSLKKLCEIYLTETPEITKPPYNFICQVGNPVLRQKTSFIDEKIIQTQEFQKILDHLYKLLKKHDTVGLAAPQIGLPWQLFAIEVTEESVKCIHPYIRKCYDIIPYPLTYFINPKMKIINSEEIVHFETCASIHCYYAEVPRPKEVQIEALNKFGEPFSMKAEGWLARIIHHEMDHLKGHLYTDRMFPFSFNYDEWDKIDKSEKDIVN